MSCLRFHRCGVVLLIGALALAATSTLAVPLKAAPSAPEASTTLNATQAAYTDQGAADTAFGGGSGLQLGLYDFQGTFNRRYVYLQFDVSGIPVGSDVVGAKLRLFQQSASGADEYWVWTWTAPAGWSENKLTWTNQPWPANPAGPAAPISRSAGQWFEWDVAAIVEPWIQDGAPAYGIVLSGNTSNLGEHLFEGRLGKYPPQLVIDYTAGATPTSTATRTAAPTDTPTGTPTGTPTRTTTFTNTPTRSTATPTATATQKATFTPTPTFPTPAGGAPDLSVTDLWYEGGGVHFQVRNVGNGAAPPPVFAHLRIDGAYRGNTSMAGIAPWTRLDSYFPTSVACTGLSITARVDVEFSGATDANLANNVLEKVLRCDPTPPAFTQAPAVSGLTSDQATICWKTGEKVVGRVLYDRRSGLLGQRSPDQPAATSQCVTLVKLEAGAGYAYQVEIEDASKNRTNSPIATFVTRALTDGQAPILNLSVPKLISGTTILRATASDDKAVDRIRFSVDGKTLQTCYGSSCVLQLDTSLLADGPHNLRVQSVDAAGNQSELTAVPQIRNSLDHLLSPIHVAVSPAEDTELYGQVHVRAQVRHDLLLPLQRLEFVVNGVVQRTVTYAPCTRYLLETYCEGATPLTETFTYDASALPVGTRLTVAVRAYDGQSPANWNETVRHLDIVTPPDPRLEVRREVTRVNATVKVELALRNTGVVPVDHVHFEDRSGGFQAGAYMQYRREPSTEWSARQPCTIPNIDEWAIARTEIRCDYGEALYPGETVRVRYPLVPVMQAEASHYLWHADPVGIGRQLNVTYQSFGRTFSQQRNDLLQESTALRAAAIRESDYLILIDASQTYDYRRPNQVYELLGKLAELAEVRRGVIGNAVGFQPSWIKGVLFPQWGEQMRRDWFGMGYLLLAESTDCYNTETRFWPEYTEGVIDCADSIWADTQRGDGIPDLRVGRLVGTHAMQMAFLRNSLDVARGEGARTFDRSQATIVTGPEGTTEAFIANGRETAQRYRNASPPTTVIRTIDEEFNTTPVALRRDALAILGEYYQCSPAQQYHTPLPATLNHLQHLTCQYGYHGLPSPPEDLATLQGLISEPDAVLVEHTRRTTPQTPYAMHGNGNDPLADWRLAHAASSAATAATLPGADIYYWSGHGGPGAWDQFTRGNFGSTSGVVISNSCETGQYWRVIPGPTYDTIDMQDGGAPGSAALAGAAAFIGATEVSPIGPSDAVTAWLTDRQGGDWNNNRPLGDALALAKWRIRTDGPGSMYEYVIQEFNLYGDPKFGAIGALPGEGGPPSEGVPPSEGTPLSEGLSVAAGPATDAATPQETWQVAVPAYEITTSAGVSRVTIPGGLLTTEVGQPETPYTVVHHAVPTGKRVSDVRVVSRDAPQIVADVILPTFTAQLAGAPAGVPARSSEAPAARALNFLATGEWYPAGDFDWEETVDPTGRPTLVVTLYPFQYAAARGEARFYGAWTLEVTYADAPATILRLETDAPRYKIGEPVNVALDLDVTGAAPRLVLSVAVIDVASGEAVDGLPLRNLPELTGPSRIEDTWESLYALPGDYALEAQLVDASGEVLAKERARFRLGYAQAEVTSFEATPAQFLPGAAVSFKMGVRNSGDEFLTGRAVIEIFGADGAEVKRFEQMVNLKGGEAAVQEASWDSWALKAGQYRAVGYVEVLGRRSNFTELALRAGRVLWMPFTAK